MFYSKLFRTVLKGTNPFIMVLMILLISLLMELSLVIGYRIGKTSADVVMNGCFVNKNGNQDLKRANFAFCCNGSSAGLRPLLRNGKTTINLVMIGCFLNENGSQHVKNVNFLFYNGCFECLTPAKARDVEMVDAASSGKKTPNTPNAESVGNLACSVDQADAENFFKDCGQVVDVHLATDEDGSFKGFGHVEFGTDEAIFPIEFIKVFFPAFCGPTAHTLPLGPARSTILSTRFFSPQSLRVLTMCKLVILLISPSLALCLIQCSNLVDDNELRNKSNYIHDRGKFCFVAESVGCEEQNLKKLTMVELKMLWSSEDGALSTVFGFCIHKATIDKGLGKKFRV